MNFLSVLERLLVDRPGTYRVRAEVEDLFPALAQVCIKWLAADAREQLKASGHPGRRISGGLLPYSKHFNPDRNEHGNPSLLPMMQVLNKIVHGDPTWVVSREGKVYLYFEHQPPYAGEIYADEPYIAWFSGREALESLRAALFSHEDRRSQEAELLNLIKELGEQRFLPRPDQ
jgi:hypothetical protein